MQVLTDVKSFRLTGWRAFVATLLGAGLTAACAQFVFYLPGNPIPITLQVFAVVCCGFVLGGRWAAIAQMEYLFAGLMGAPVFSTIKAGPLAFVGPTAGFLIGFVPMAYVVGTLVERARREPASAMAAGFAGVCTLYVFGTLWFALGYGSSFPGSSVWLVTIAPFVCIDAAKVVAAALVCVGRRGK